ncbi:HD-GYP domain-containing protein [Ornithinimicrobium cerasi]|uniref:HD-GYP domain-containing protein n=1 Tax=Ornithinimicrobium cerasi TaxID=2248773 RepID=UPI000EFE46DC|nr:HD domain-containing phosphohydrolase [Ornithinimicrobium cerasi]
MHVWLYVLTLAALGVGLTWVAWTLPGGDGPIAPSVLVILVVLGAVGVVLRERDLGPHLGISLATVVLAAALPLAGVGAVIVGFVSYACDTRRQSLRTRAFNAVMTALVGAVGAVVYLLLGGARIDAVAATPGELIPRVGLPLLVAYAVMTLVNVLLYAVMSSLVRGTLIVDTAWQALRSLGLAYLGHVIIAFLFAVLWGPAGLGPLSALFVLGPLLAAHWSIGREALARREHEETVATFVAALEQADPASVGHSARVADLADLMAPQLGIGGRAAQDLRYAALLHDIGLVTTRSQLSEDAAPDEVAYLSALSVHPESGVRVLSGLDFLDEALPAIAHHHERWDGRGYPAGLSHENIPLAARVIAVADAYDALTTDGDVVVGAEEALGLLRQRAGTHLDPDVVEALAAVLQRVTQPVRRGATLPVAPTGSAHGPTPALPDHDHPRASDAFAEWQPETAAWPS